MHPLRIKILSLLNSKLLTLVFLFSLTKSSLQRLPVAQSPMQVTNLVNFSAPEVFLKQEYSPKVDVFSVGCLFYIL
jgi:serine/threonine protein kinase